MVPLSVCVCDEPKQTAAESYICNGKQNRKPGTMCTRCTKTHTHSSKPTNLTYGRDGHWGKKLDSVRCAKRYNELSPPFCWPGKPVVPMPSSARKFRVPVITGLAKCYCCSCCHRRDPKPFDDSPRSDRFDWMQSANSSASANLPPSPSPLTLYASL